MIEDWDKHLGASRATFLFDSTVAFDGSNVYRGECDASHKSIPGPGKGAGPNNGANKGAEKDGIAMAYSVV